MCARREAKGERRRPRGEGREAKGEGREETARDRPRNPKSGEAPAARRQERASEERALHRRCWPRCAAARPQGSCLGPPAAGDGDAGRLPWLLAATVTVTHVAWRVVVVVADGYLGFWLMLISVWGGFFVYFRLGVRGRGVPNVFAWSRGAEHDDELPIASVRDVASDRRTSTSLLRPAMAKS